MNQRERITVSWLDLVVFRFLKCNCYRLFKGMQFYKGKIIYEGEVKLRQDGDIGNVLQQLRNAYTTALFLLNKDGALLLKLQHAKMIDIVEPVNVKFNEADSEANNQPSLEDMRDFYNMFTLEGAKIDNVGAAPASKGEKGKNKKQAPEEAEVTPGNVIGHEVEMRVNNFLNAGVLSIQPTIYGKDGLNATIS